jgi:hypothetical protein
MKKFTSKTLDVTWAYDLKKTLQENFSNRQWAKLSQYVVDQQILKDLSKGNSPVNKARRLAKYSERYTKAIKGELGKKNNKTVRPVNLTLTGSMLSNYDARPGEDTFEITLGIHGDAPELDKTKAGVHNVGNKKTPRRPFVPLAGESFTRKITLEIRKLFAYCLDQAINRRKNR